MDGSCPTADDKVMLAYDSACIAKVQAVKEHGIGEDLTFNIFAWWNDKLTAVANLDHVHMRDRKRRFERTAQAAAIFRRAWASSELTFVAEGYCAVDPDNVDARPFAEQFVNNPAVSECISIVHSSPTAIAVTAIPYRYELGRKVVFDPPLRYNLDATSIEGTMYPEVFMRIMKEVEVAEIPKTERIAYFDALTESLAQLGWMTTYAPNNLPET